MPNDEGHILTQDERRTWEVCEVCGEFTGRLKRSQESHDHDGLCDDCEEEADEG